MYNKLSHVNVCWTWAESPDPRAGSNGKINRNFGNTNLPFISQFKNIYFILTIE